MSNHWMPSSRGGQLALAKQWQAVITAKAYYDKAYDKAIEDLTKAINWDYLGLLGAGFIVKF